VQKVGSCRAVFVSPFICLQFHSCLIAKWRALFLPRLSVYSLILSRTLNMSTSPSTLHGWVDQPNNRGTFGIISSCFLTIFLCTWTSLHLNVPAAKEGTWRALLRKFRWMVLTILGPEFVGALAAGQRANAKRTLDTLRGMGYSEWTLRHSFYANMGGFVLQPRDSTPFPVHGLHLIYLVKEGYLTLPEITDEEISDKSKANLLAKVLVCLQTGWFVVQCFGRVAQNLPLTTLELTTISYVWCTWAIYAQWLKKPLDVEVPTVLRIKASTAEILAKAGPAASQPYRQTPLDFVWDWRNSWTLNVQPFLHFRVDPRERPMPRILNDSLPWFSSAFDSVVCVFVVVFYGAIHMFGWNFIFPTRRERILWHIAALVLLCTTTAFCMWEVVWGISRAAYRLYLNKKKIRFMSVYYVFANKNEKVFGAAGYPVQDKIFDDGVITAGQLIFLVPLAVLYLLSRLYTIVEPLASLRALPGGCFQTVDWTKFIPHF